MAFRFNSFWKQWSRRSVNLADHGRFAHLSEISDAKPIEKSQQGLLPIQLDTLEDRILYDASPLGGMMVDSDLIIDHHASEQILDSSFQPLTSFEAIDQQIDAIESLCNECFFDTDTFETNVAAPFHVDTKGDTDLDSDDSNLQGVDLELEILYAWETLNRLDLISIDETSILIANEDPNQSTARMELVVLDRGVADYQQILDVLQQSADQGTALSVLLVDETSDGLAAITDYLQRAAVRFNAIHFITHGTGGAFQLGSTLIDASLTDSRHEEFASWGSWLDDDADLLLYGCDLASTKEGRALVDAIAMLTGADVAASDNATGHSDLGGDWQFEYVVGNIETQVAVSQEFQSQWVYTLDAALLFDPADDDDETLIVDPSIVATDFHRIELVFVDTGVADYETILADLQSRAGTGTLLHVALIDSDADGLSQVNDHLSQLGQPLDAIHFITHGTDRAFKFGSTWFDAQAAESRQGEFEQWSGSLKSGGDLLFYGCDLASTQAGRDLLESLADWTGLDIAASETSIGAESLGGNWLLEYQIGEIESQIVVSAALQAEWYGLLDTFTVTNNSDSGAGSLRQAILDANALAGHDTIQFAIGATGSFQTIALIGPGAGLVITDSVTIDGRTQGGTGYNGLPLIYITNPSLPKVDTGIHVQANNVTLIGIAVSGFNSDGILVENVSNFTLQNSAVGINPSILAANANGRDGVRLNNVTNSMIGGTEHWERNMIALNSARGVNILGTSNNIAVLGNLFQGNTTLDLDLGGNGVTANDTGDGDTGPNGLQNFPVLTSAHSTPDGTRVIGSLNSNANTTYRIEFFNNFMNNQHSSGYGGGRTLLGTIEVTTDGSGNASFDTTVTGWLNAGDRVTATATVVLGVDSYGSTSEFSQQVTGTSTGVVVVTTAANNTGGNTSSIAALQASRGGDNRISLREAILAANNTANSGGAPDLIAFDILTWSKATITVTSSDLQELWDPVRIDASTQRGYNGDPLISIVGGAGRERGFRLWTASDGSEIRGLNIQGFTVAGIDLAGSNNHTVAGNWIGTNAAGTGAAGNANGINVWNSNNNTLGGTGIHDDNVISGNTNLGIQLGGGSTGNQILGNYIGTDATGTFAVANGVNGINVFNAPNTVIGGTAAGAGNVISGNANRGVYISNSAGTQLLGNLIGLDATGGSALGNGSDGVYLWNATDVAIGDGTVGGRNVISGSARRGIFIEQSSQITIQGNYIGTDISGNNDVTGTGSNNLQSGILVRDGSTNVTIGGYVAGQGNVISGNNWYGVEFIGAGTSNNLMVGNIVGLNAAGTAALGNSQGGVSFFSSASNNTLGGGQAGARNIISGNMDVGVYIANNNATGNKVQGNYIGLGADGSTVFGNSNHGILIVDGATNNIIGTDNDGVNDATEGNVISGNINGVVIIGVGVTGNVVAGNLIGTDATGTLDRGNTIDGVRIESGAANNTIGGTAAGAGNIIAGSGYAGIEINGASTSGNLVQGNFIGTDSTGTLDLGNTIDGIRINNGANNNMIGGTAVGAGNTIAFNGRDGVRVESTAGSGNAILGNRIYSNSGLGINLVGGSENAFGVTANDLGDADTGPNSLQNYPVIASAALIDGVLHVTGTLDSTAERTFRIEIFATETADASGHGQGKRFLGTTFVTTDINGQADLDQALMNADVAAGEVISLTATDMTTNNTSEFALAVAVALVNVAPSFHSGTGFLTTAIPGSTSSQFNSTLVMPDGKIVAVGWAMIDGTRDTVLVRYNVDGSLDTSFGSGGIVITNVLPGALDQANDVILLSDGRLLITGQAGGADIFLAKYNQDGSLDTSFGSGAGFALSGISGWDAGVQVVELSDGKLLVAGDNNNDFLVARFNASGTLDTSFGSSGRITTDFAGGIDAANGLVVQPDGKFVVTGYAWIGTSWDIAVARYIADGTLDTSFGSGGRVLTDVGSNTDDRGTAIAIQDDGKLVVAGWGNASGTNDYYVLRYNTDGTLDTTFGGGSGYTITGIGTTGTQSDFALALALQPDGRIVLAGYSSNEGRNFAAVRYNSDGSLDTSFGTGGIVDSNFGGSSDDRAHAVAIGPDGKIVLAGWTNWGGTQAAVMRLNVDGSLDTRFHLSDTLGGSISYTDNAAPVVLDDNVVIYDADLSAADNFDGASLTLTRSGGANGQDLFSATGLLGTLVEGGNLVFNGTTIGTVTTNSGGTLVVTFNANATNTLVNSAMRAIAYANSSDDPPAEVQIDWTFSDGNTGTQGTGGALTAIGSTTVNISAVNHAPEKADIEPTPLAYTEKDGPVAITSTITVNDVDNTHLTSASIQITGNYLASEDTLAFANQNGITGSWDAITGTLTLSGSATLADYQAALRSITYENSSLDPSTATRTVTFRVNDGELDSDPLTREITITAVNDVPMITVDGGDSDNASLVETNAGLFVQGTLSVNDPDSADIVSGDVSDLVVSGTSTGMISSHAELLAMLTVTETVIAAGDTSGSLTWSFNSGSEAFDYLAVGETLTLTYTVQVTDSQDATDTQEVTITITGTNDAPIAGSDDFANKIDTPLLLDVLENDFDIDGDPLTITHVNGSEISIGQTILVANGSVRLEADGRLLFTPTTGFSGVTSFTYAIADGNGGTDTASVSISIIPGSLPRIDLDGDDRPIDETFADNIVSGNYSNNSGSLTWSSDWIESDDDGSPNAGSVSIVTDGTREVLQFNDGSVQIRRSADLSNYESAILSFDVRRVSLPAAPKHVVVEVSSDGINFIEIGRFAGPANDAAYWQFQFDISEFISSDFTLRIRSPNPLNSGEFVRFDNFVIAVSNLTLDYATSFTVGDPPIAIGATSGVGIDIFDLDSTHLNQARIALTNPSVGDVLSIEGTLPIGITAAFNGPGNILTLSGVASKADYELALQQVRFHNTSQDPLEGVRTIEVTVRDTTNLVSNPAVASINVIAVNDAPEKYDIEPTPLAYTEKDGPVAITSTITVNDVDNTHLTSASIQITGNYLAGEDALAFTDQNGITGSWDAITGTLTLNGSATLADYQAALRSITYENSSLDPSTTTRTVTFRVNDGELDSVPLTREITITAVNDAPVITVDGGDSDNTSLVETNAGLYVQGTLSVNDPDSADIVSGVVSGLVVSGTSTGLISSHAELLAMLTVTETVIAAGDTSGSLTWSFDSGSEAFDYLAVGQTLTLTYTVQVEDSQGTSDTQEVVIIVTGTNDAPVISVEVGDSAGETLSVTGATLTSGGTLSVADLDRTDTVSAAITTFSKTGDFTGLTLSDAQLEAMLALNAAVISDIQQAGTINWGFDSAGFTFGYLGANESITLVYTITVTDSQNATDTQDITIVIHGDNSAPVISVRAGNSDAETLVETNSTLATTGTLSVTDINTTDEVTSTVTQVIAAGTTTGLQSDNAALLAMLTVNANVIDGTTETGTITWSFDSSSEAFDYLAVGQWLTLTYTIQAEDSQGASTTHPVNITISGTNDAPVITSFEGSETVNLAIEENETTVVTVIASDVDQSDTLQYSINGGSDAWLFTIDPNTGELRFINPPDFENPLNSNGDNVYEVIVEVSDGIDTDQQRFVVSVRDVNEYPVGPISDLDVTADFVMENSAFGTSVGIVAYAEDVDGSDTVSYTLDDNAGGQFAIDASTGVVTVAGPIDREAVGSTLEITVRATSTDGSFSTRTFTIAIGDENEFDVTEPIDIDPTANQVDENPLDGTPVGIVAYSVDQDATNNEVTYSLIDDADGRFTIDSQTGVVTVGDGSLINYRNATEHQIIVRATSADGSTAEAVFRIEVNGLNSASDGDPNTYQIATGTTLQSNPGVLANDQDADGDSLTAILTVGPSHGNLQLNSDGTFVYYPNGGFVGVDTFAYLPFDGLDVGSLVVVTIDVQGIAGHPGSPSRSNPSPGTIYEMNSQTTTNPSQSQPESNSGATDGSNDSEQLIERDGTTGDSLGYLLSALEEENSQSSDSEDIYQRDEGASDLVRQKQLRDKKMRQEAQDKLKFIDYYRLNQELRASRDVEAEERRVAAAMKLRYANQFLLKQIDEIGDNRAFQVDSLQLQVGSIVTLSTISYLAWAFRGSVLASAALAYAPSWLFIDPLPVLDHYISNRAKKTGDKVDDLF